MTSWVSVFLSGVIIKKPFIAAQLYHLSKVFISTKANLFSLSADSACYFSVGSNIRESWSDIDRIT